MQSKPKMTNSAGNHFPGSPDKATGKKKIKINPNQENGLRIKILEI